MYEKKNGIRFYVLQFLAWITNDNDWEFDLNFFFSFVTVEYTWESRDEILPYFFPSCTGGFLFHVLCMKNVNTYIRVFKTLQYFESSWVLLGNYSTDCFTVYYIFCNFFLFGKNHIPIIRYPIFKYIQYWTKRIKRLLFSV